MNLLIHLGVEHPGPAARPHTDGTVVPDGLCRPVCGPPLCPSPDPDGGGHLPRRPVGLPCGLLLPCKPCRLHPRPPRRAPASYLCSFPALFLLALAVKETAATLPAALLLWEITRQDRPFRLP
ncbi:MAG: hypothetical protein MZU97_07750 [Bacillus subtilis]|nr:hypothetical protein [Bacillus subtilis]